MPNFVSKNYLKLILGKSVAGAGLNKNNSNILFFQTKSRTILWQNTSLIILIRNTQKNARPHTFYKFLGKTKNLDNHTTARNFAKKKRCYTKEQSKIKLHRKIKMSSKNNNEGTNANLTPLQKFQIHCKKTSCQPFPKKIEKNRFFSDNKIKTEITPLTKKKNISDKHFREEMFIRGLLQQYKNNFVNILLADNSIACVGASESGYKFSTIGQAYWEQLEKNKINRITTIQSIAKEASMEEFMNNVYIGTISFIKGFYFLELSEQKHLLLVKYYNGIHYVFGYLTSKKTSDYFTEIKYKNYEKKQQNVDINNTSTDTQHFFCFDSVLQITTEKVDIVKYSKEYLGTLSADTKIFLKEALDKTLNVMSFKTKKFTSNDGLIMCKKNDAEVLINRNKPPLTKEQVKINELSEKKQAIDHKSKKKISPKESHESL